MQTVLKFLVTLFPFLKGKITVSGVHAVERALAKFETLVETLHTAVEAIENEMQKNAAETDEAYAKFVETRTANDAKNSNLVRVQSRALTAKDNLAKIIGA